MWNQLKSKIRMFYSHHVCEKWIFYIQLMHGQILDDGIIRKTDKKHRRIEIMELLQDKDVLWKKSKKGSDSFKDRWQHLDTMIRVKEKVILNIKMGKISWISVILGDVSNPLDCYGIFIGSHITFSVMVEWMNYGNVALILGYLNTLGLLVTGEIKSCHWNQREWELFVKFLHESCFVVWQVYQHPYSSSEMRTRGDRSMTKSPKSSNYLD